MVVPTNEGTPQLFHKREDRSRLKLLFTPMKESRAFKLMDAASASKIPSPMKAQPKAKAKG
eukprot:2258101-Alexandrium_andersonii.AAC.1